MTVDRRFLLLALLPMAILWNSELQAQQHGSKIAAGMAGLRDKDPAVCWTSVTALTRAGAEAVPSLAAALGDRTENVRAYSALALARMGQPSIGALRELILALRDSS